MVTRRTYLSLLGGFTGFFNLPETVFGGASSKLEKLKKENARLRSENKELRRELNRRDSDVLIDVNAETVLLNELKASLESNEWFDIDNWSPMNEEYRTVSKKEFEKLAKNLEIHEKEYEPSYFDCVEFTTLLRSKVAEKYRLNSVGSVVNEYNTHEFNVVLLSDGSVRFWEPQNAEWVTPEDDERYRLEGASIRI